MNAWQITRKDLKLLFRDRRALVTLILFPLVFITIIGLTTGQLLGWKENNEVLTIAMVDGQRYETVGRFADPADNAGERKVARNLIVKIFNGVQQKNGLAIYELTEPGKYESLGARARAAYQNDDDANAAMLVGPDFYHRAQSLELRNVMAGDLRWFEDGRPLVNDDDGKPKIRENAENPDRPFRLRLDEYDNEVRDRSRFLAPGEEVDLDDPNTPGKIEEGLAALDVAVESDNLEGSTHSIIEQFIYGEAIAAVGLPAACKEQVIRNQIAGQCNKLDEEVNSPPIEPLAPEPVADDGANRVYQEIIPGYTVMFVFFLINIMARSFIQERELGTLRRLRIAPVHPASLLLGKTIPFFVISVLQTILLFVAGKLLFGMEWGPLPWMLIPVGLSTSLAATALGLLVATVVRTEAQVSSYANLVVITMAGISGCFLPREWLPQSLQTVSLATPHSWALIAYEQLLSFDKPDVGGVWISCIAMVLFAVGYFVIGCLRFGRHGE